MVDTWHYLLPEDIIDRIYINIEQNELSLDKMSKDTGVDLSKITKLVYNDDFSDLTFGEVVKLVNWSDMDFYFEYLR